MLKRTLTIMLCATVLLTGVYTQAFAESPTHTEPITLYSEDFENGEFTFDDRTIDGNNAKYVMKDGEDPEYQWILQKRGGAEIPGTWALSPISQRNDTGNIANKSKALTSGGHVVQHSILYLNLPKVYTTGILTFDYRMRRPNNLANERRLCMLLYDDQINSFNDLENDHNAADTVLYTAMESSSSGTRQLRRWAYIDGNTPPENPWNAFTKDTSWWRFRYTVDIDAKTIKLERSRTSDAVLTPWDGGSGDTIINFGAHNAAAPYSITNNSVGSFAFRGENVDGGTVLIDDITITYQAPLATDVITGLNLTDQNGDTISSENPISLSSVTALGANAVLNHIDTDVTARLTIAAFDEDNTLLAVRMGEDFTADATTPVESMTVVRSLDIQSIKDDIKTIRVFAWDFAAIRPYAVLEQSVQ